MNTQPLHHRLSAQDYNALKDAAKTRAVELRREAIDEFWSDVANALRRLARVRLKVVLADRTPARSVSY